MEKAGVIGSNFCEKKKERIRKKEFLLNPYPVNFEQEKLFEFCGQKEWEPWMFYADISACVSLEKKDSRD